jgi:hypothetical protein
MKPKYKLTRKIDGEMTVYNLLIPTKTLSQWETTFCGVIVYRGTHRDWTPVLRLRVGDSLKHISITRENAAHMLAEMKWENGRNAWFAVDCAHAIKEKEMIA